MGRRKQNAGAIVHHHPFSRASDLSTEPDVAFSTWEDVDSSVQHDIDVKNVPYVEDDRECPLKAEREAPGVCDTAVKPRDSASQILSLPYETVLQCRMCLFTSQFVSLMETHVAQHRGNYLCPLCNITFEFQCHFQEHLEFHNNDDSRKQNGLLHTDSGIPDSDRSSSSFSKQSLLVKYRNLKSKPSSLRLHPRKRLNVPINSMKRGMAKVVAGQVDCKIESGVACPISIDNRFSRNQTTEHILHDQTQSDIAGETSNIGLRKTLVNKASASAENLLGSRNPLLSGELSPNAVDSVTWSKFATEPLSALGVNSDLNGHEFDLELDSALVGELNSSFTTEYVAELDVLGQNNNAVPCKYCFLPFHEEAALAQHLKSFHPDMKFMCTFCNEIFEKQVQFLYHMNRHKGIVFRCKCCNYFTAYKTNMSCHLKVHGERKFKCDVCGYAFRYNNHLKEHMRLHTGERPFKCSFCSKRFHQRSHVKLHELVHTGERPHKCSLCGDAFKRKDELRAHMRSHTGEVLRCDECDFTTRIDRRLSEHKKWHSGKVFSCTVCDYRSVYQCNVKKHMEMHVQRPSDSAETLLSGALPLPVSVS